MVLLFKLGFNEPKIPPSNSMAKNAHPGAEGNPRAPSPAEEFGVGWCRRHINKKP